MSNIKNIFIIWLLFSLQSLWANSIHVEKNWNLLSNFDTNQSIECLLKKFDQPTTIWFYDNYKKEWIAKSNSDKINISISNYGITSSNILEAYQSFWLNSPIKKDITLDCDISKHIDFNNTKILNKIYNKISLGKYR